MDLQELLENGIIWIKDGEYVAKDPDEVVCALWTVGYHEQDFEAALAVGYGEFNPVGSN